MVTEARLSVLTNGIVYRFFSDLEKPNIMDNKPFLELDLLDIKEPLVEELKKFTKSSFDIGDILSTANELKYTREIKRILAEQLMDPSDDFVRFFASQLYSGRMTQSVREMFTGMTKRAFHQLISDRISDRLKSALAGETAPHTADDVADQEELTVPEGEQEKDSRIVTTEEETEGYYIVKSILREVTDVGRISMRDRVNYCAILFDGSILKTICRLWFNRRQKYLGVFDQKRKEERIPIDTLDDIYRHAERLKATVSYLEDPTARAAPSEAQE